MINVDRTPDDLGFLDGGGEMGALMRARDWSTTSLGNPARWPQSLRTMVRLMLNTCHPMYIFWGGDGACLYNDAYRPSIGSERHPFSLGRPAREVWDEIWPIIGPQIVQVRSGRGATWDVDALIPITRNGVREDVYWTYSYSPIDDEDAPNRIGGVLVVCTETTAQVEGARHLAQIEERLNLALSAGGGIGTWMWDVPADRVITDERFARMFGVPLAQAQAGAPIEVFFKAMHADDVARVAARIDDALESGESFSEEYRLVRPNGGVRWVAAKGRAELSAQGVPLRFPGVCIDITDRKLAERRLIDLNADLERQVVERTRERGLTWQITPDLLGVLNDDGIFESSNPAWQATLGLSEAAIASTPIFELIHPDDVAKSLEAFALVKRGEPVLNLENRYRHVDGGYRWLSWMVVPEGGKYYATAHDISGEKQRAAALAEAEDALRHSQKLEAVGQLTGGVAHDFNNLLTVIRGSVDLLRLEGIGPEKRKRYIEAIREASDRAAKLTAQLLAFARRQALKPETFEAGAAIDELADMVRTLTGARITFEAHGPLEPAFILADRGQFDTCIINMSVNARDAMGGEGLLTIAVAPVSGIPAIRANSPIAGEFVAVTISDTGSGIEPSRLADIFEPFFTTKIVGEGTGLGLSQVLGFARQSGGDVRVESELGRGTSFTLYLPRAERDEHPNGDAARSEPAPDGKGLCVLVVEDNEVVGEFATAALQELGYQTMLAPNATEALAALDADCSRFHVVFSDVVMPGMSGIELAEVIRQRHGNVPIVLVSGYSRVLAQNGNQGYELLQKPYSIEQLARVLRKAAAWPMTRKATS